MSQLIVRLSANEIEIEPGLQTRLFDFMQHCVPCYVYFRSYRGWEQNNTAAPTLFGAALQALSWFREWYSPKPTMNTILKIQAGWASEQQTYYVRARRVLEHYGLDPREYLED